MADKTRTGGWILAVMAFGFSAPAAAQDGFGEGDYRRAIGAAILSDVARDRQAERDVRRAPYATPGYGPIGTIAQARDACAAEAISEAGGNARLAGKPVASSMSTGWEVEGEIDPGDKGDRVPFVCSVRNGAVSGIMLK